MNKFYRVVFNHATQTWTAVAEFAKSKGKTKSVKLSAVATAIAAAATVGGTAHAAVSIGTTTGTTIATEAGGTASAGISIGQGASTETANDIAIGQGASIDRGDPGSPVGSIVIGNKAESTGQFGDIVIGAFSKTGKALGHPGTPSQITVIGSRSFAYGNQASVLSSDAVATGSSSIAMGGDDINDARVVLDRDIAEFTAATNPAIKNNYEYIWGLVDPALTDRLKNTKIDMANYGAVNPELKNTAAANLNNSHFLRTWAAGDASIALGYAAQTLGTGSHAVGINAVAYSTASNAIGVLARAGDKTDVANSTNANAFGTAAVAAAKDANAFGHNATVASGAVGAIAFGVNASATAASNVVIGSNSSELSSTNTVGGKGAAIDSGTVGGVPYSGFAGEDKLVGVVSVGNGDQTRQIINVAPGAITAESTDAINGSQLYQVLKPITFTANSNKDAAVTDNGANFAANDGAQIPLNETLNIIGATASKDLSLNSDAAVDGTYSAKNIQTVVTTNNQLQIQMAENPQFKSVQLDEEQIPASADATKADAPTFPNGGKNAISANDLMNTGWNLQANDTAVDLVNPYNTVNFKGEGVTITPETDGNKSTLTFKVEQPTAGTFKADENGSVAPTDGEGDKFASVQGVADAVNNSYWNINTSQDGAGEAKVGDGKVNPSNDVVINGKDAVKVTAGTSTDNKYVIDIAVEADGSTVEIKDGKITAKTAPLAAEPVADLTAPTAGKIAAPAGDAGNALTTAANVAEMINAAAWKATSAATAAGENTGTSVELVQAGDTVTFEADSGVKIAQAGEKFTFSVKTDSTTTRINDKGEIEAIAPETATVTNVAEGQDKAGSVVAPTAEEGAKLVNAQTLANAINNSGFTLKHSVTDGEDKGGAEEVINPGDVVDMVAGKNLSVQQEANGRIIYATKDKVEFTEVKVGGDVANNPITIGTNPEGKNVISGLDTRIPEAVTKTDPATKPAGDELKNAATLGDVLNAAWNLQRDGQDVDAVTPYNTVNHTSFKQGEAVAQGIEITHDTDGDVSNIRYAVKVDNTTTRINDKGEVEAIQPTAGTFKADENGSLAPTDATEGNKLASVQGVSDAVNNSYWNINTSQDGANKAAVGDGKVNPSNNVVINGTGAVEVKAGTSTDNEYVIDVAVKTDNTTIKVNDQGQLEAIAPATATMAAAPTADLTAPTAGTITAGDAPTALTTAQNVADMINAAAWKATSAATAAGENTGTSVELVQAGDTVTFEADSGVKIVQAGEKFTFSVKTDNTTTRINDKGEIEAIAPETATVTNVAEGQDKAGSVVAPTAEEGAKLVNAQTLANAINNSGFTLKHSVTDGEDKGGAEEVINPGDVVDMVAGKNLSVQQEANGRIIYATKDKVEFTEVKVGGDVANNPITIGTNPAGENVISGLSNTLAPLNVNPAETKAPTFDDAKLGSAATLSDVLNAGWNLQNNSEAKDFVKAYDTVNFVDGAGTKAVVDVKADGTIADVKYDVQVDDTTVKIVDGKLTAVQPATSVDGNKVGGDTNFGDSDTINATTNAAGDIVFEAKTTDLTPATGDKEGSVAAPTEEAGKQLVNATTVANAINNSGWKATSSATAGENTGSTVELINPSETVTFDADSGIKIAQDANKFSFSVKTDGTTTRINDKGEVEAIAPATAQIAPNTDGSVTGPVNNPALQDALTAAQDELAALPDTATEEEKKAAQDKVDAAQNAINNAPNALATAQNVADAINASGFTLKTGAQESGKNATPDASELINPSDTVTMIAGDNLVVAQEGGNVVYSLNPDININSAKIGGVPNPADAANPTKAPITIGTVDENGTPKNVIAGLDSTLPETVNGAAPTTSQAAPTLAPADLTKAATVGDVLNAGWNLKANNADVDFVKPYDTVNFVDGKGTKVVTSTDSETSNVQIDVDVTQLSAPITNNADGSVTAPANSTELADAVKAAEDALAALPADATPEEKAAAEKAVQDAKDAVTNAGNALATAQNVADAINASGWNATSGKVGTGVVSGTTNELINPSEVVTFQAGDNMVLEQAGNVFTYSVSKDPVFNSVKVGGNAANGNAPITIGTTPEGDNVIDGLTTTIAAPTTASNPADKPAADKLDNAATLGDVLNAGWNLQANGEAKDSVTPFDAVNFADGVGTNVVVESKDGVNTVKVNVDLNDVVTPVTADENGTIAAPADANKLATAGDIQTAINNSGWKATSGKAGSGVANGTTTELVKPSETVTFKAGDNLVIDQAGQDFTYSLNKDIAINSAKIGNADAPITIGTDAAGNNVIDGLTTTIAAPTTEVKPADKPTADKLDNAATLGDVLNAGWNLQENGTAKDVVTPYDTVNFANGAGTTVNITSDGATSVVKVDVAVDDTTVKIVDGKLTAVQPDTLVNGNKVGGNINLVDSDTVSVVPGDNPGDIKFNVNTAAITPVTEGDKAGSVTGPVTPALADALKAAQDELAALPADASEEAKQAAADKVAAAQNAVNKAGNAVATAQNVADAINASGWNATSGKVGTGVVSGTTKELINPSETVTFNAGDNLVLEQNGNEFTYSLNKDINVNSVTANQAIFGGSPATEDAPAKAPIIIGTTPAGKNVVSNLDTTIAAPTTANNPADKPTEAQQSNAATLGDVLNAGWNLQENGTAKDVVTPYDTVNFANGNATTVNITTDGTTSVVKVDVATDNTTVEIKDGKIAAKTSPITNAANGSVNAPANPAALATAGDVANAINGSGFTLTAQGANGSVVNPGETVDMKNTDGNISITKDAANNDVVYNLNPTINVTNVNATGNVAAGSVSINGAATQGSPAPTVTLTTVAGNNLAADGNSAGSYAVTPNALSVATNGNPNQITGVANGAIRPGSTDAVNGGQLYALGANINNRIDDLDDARKAGSASAMAAAGLPQAFREGQSGIVAAIGQYQGQTGLAVGFTSISDNGRLLFRGSYATNTQNEHSGNVGMGIFW